MSFSRNADPCEPFPASSFGSCSRPRNELASLSTHRVVDHPCIFMRRQGVPITHASADERRCVQAYLCTRLYVGNAAGNRQFTLVVNIRGAPSRREYPRSTSRRAYLIVDFCPAPE
jgi:hypothetical protein